MEKQENKKLPKYRPASHMFTAHICLLKSINCHWDTIDLNPENGCICFTKKQKIKAAEHAKKYVRNRFKYIKNVTPEYIGRSSAIFGAAEPCHNSMWEV